MRFAQFKTLDGDLVEINLDAVMYFKSTPKDKQVIICFVTGDLLLIKSNWSEVMAIITQPKYNK